MSFFLLGRTAASELRLLSATTFETRAQAMAELQRLTADASFTDWDAEVFVVDLNAATPVLLVRPTAESAQVAEGAQSGDDAQPAADAGAESPEEGAEDAFAIAAAPMDEVEPVPVDLDLTLPEEPVVAETEELVAAEEPAPEPVDAAFADAALADAAAEVDAGAPDSLKDALRRAAEDLESEGIVAPESIGPGEDAAEETEELTAEVAGETQEAAEEFAEPEPVAWPWDTAVPAEDVPAEDAPAAQSASEEIPAEEPPAEGAAVLAEGASGEPVEAPEAAPSIPYVFDPLEEPAIDATPLVTAEGDDATVAASRPVILGAYESGSPVVDSAEPESAGSAAAEQAESDFILDLESIAGIADTPADSSPTDETNAGVFTETVEPADAPMPVDSALAEMTCADCVYVETCPNKDQREPATCGSFQWRTE